MGSAETSGRTPNPTQSGRRRDIHNDLIVEKLEIARTIGLVADYVVSAGNPPRQLEPCVTVRRCANASDRAVMNYLAHLLDGIVAVHNITVTSSATSGESTSEVAPQQEPTQSMDEVKPMGSALFARAARLHNLAAAGAMLTCVAIVLNVGPSAKAPRLPATDGQAAAAVPVQPDAISGSPQQEVDARFALSNPPSADAPGEMPATVRSLMQPPPFEIIEVAASQPSNPRDADAPMDRQEPLPISPGAQVNSAGNAENPPIVGVWAPDAGTCSARDFREGMLPTVINTEGAWAGDTFCMFTKRRETDTGWTVVAKCSTPRERWTSNVQLRVTENRLTWTSRRGTQAYTRCSPDVLMAQAR